MQFDVVVVGAGHAGVEAALAASRLGKKTLILTLNLDYITLMACNPSIGGPGKAQLVREIDALGGEMAQNIDRTALQIRMLNTSKGPAVRSLRAQADKVAYQNHMRRVLEREPNLELRQAIVKRLLVKDGRVCGVLTNSDMVIEARAVILATGTYLRGEVHIGESRYLSGPQGQLPVIELADNLRDLGFQIRRFKTGTPPRVHGDSIDFSKTERQDGDPRLFFSFWTDRAHKREEVPCWLTQTTARTRELVLENLDRAPMYSGQIQSIGPRYCPSFETKVCQFPDRESHHIFLEPEGRHTKEFYVGGLSTSLPEEVQLEMLASIPGLEKAKMMRPGYAIEYDCLVPTQLEYSLAVPGVEGLFSAGQINGTSGYEEAAGQGLLAGVNAVRFLDNQPPVTIDRSEAYLGVLLDDLVGKGTDEPYRLMTSRAEYRLLLRQDNADLRLVELGREIGLIDDRRYAAFQQKKAQIDEEQARLNSTMVTPEEVRSLGENANENLSLAQLLRRPTISYGKLAAIDPERPDLPYEVAEEVEILIKYEGYIKKQESQVARFRRQEGRSIPKDLDWAKVPGLSIEGRDKLAQLRPATLGDALRRGITPADVAILGIYLERGEKASGRR
ncbi:MAG: tRNA uridine-5-carboxymethylaminomethyl(34) synthesis enzyme MnmG [Firmicutes bacterium]|jgi:tRNA uridine 5-carboxymethylaminomethyl modification enzyme|nr:tRNA uridine-5-carboxymethylaminomethyl(34) synthesis enzyme MnmG [Bacillota bacterium]